MVNALDDDYSNCMDFAGALATFIAALKAGTVVISRTT